MSRLSHVLSARARELGGHWKRRPPRTLEGQAESLAAALEHPDRTRTLTIHNEADPVIVIDPRIAQLRHLRELQVKSYRRDLVRLDGLEHLAALPELRILGLGLRALETLPEALWRLGQLEGLDLWLAVRELPAEIRHLRMLRELRLRLSITRLPEEIGELGEIETLEIGSREPMRLPESLGRLEKLRELTAYKCALTVLPDCIGHLRQLDRLDLYGNELRSLPEGIADLPNLTYLRVRENPWLQGIPARIALKEGLTIEIERGKLPPEVAAARGREAARALAELEAAAKIGERVAYLWGAAPGEGHIRGSKIGGAPYLAPEEPWPACGLCGGSMSFYLQADLEKVGLGSGLLQLFSCDRAPSVARMAELIERDPGALDQHHAEDWRELLARVPREPLERIWNSVHDLEGTMGREDRVKVLEAHGVASDHADSVMREGCQALASDGGPSCRLARIVDPLADVPPRIRPDDGDGAWLREPPVPRRITSFTEARDRPSDSDMPDTERADGLAALERDELDTVRAWNLYRDKLGGWPCWWSIGGGWPACPECGSPTTELLLQLVPDAAFSPLPGPLVVTRCRAHPRSLVSSAL